MEKGESSYTTNVGEDVEKGESSYTVGMQAGTAHSGKQYGDSSGS